MTGVTKVRPWGKYGPWMNLKQPTACLLKYTVGYYTVCGQPILTYKSCSLTMSTQVDGTICTQF